MKARVVFVLWFRWLLFFGGGIEEAEETSLVVIEVIDDELLVADWMCLVGGQTETTLLGTRRNESNESNWISFLFFCVVGYPIYVLLLPVFVADRTRYRASSVYCTLRGAGTDAKLTDAVF